MSGYHHNYGYCAPAAHSSSVFPPGTDPNIIACFQKANRDGSGFIDDKEIQTALSSYYNQSFNLRTVHLLMYLFTNSNAWGLFLRDVTEMGMAKIDVSELTMALKCQGFDLSPLVLRLLVSKFENIIVVSMALNTTTSSRAASL